MKRLIAPLFGAALTLALSAGSVLAVLPGTLDQQQTNISSSASVGASPIEGETFTAGITGNLTAVGIYIDVISAPALAPALVTPGPGSNFAIAVFPTSGGMPDTSGGPMFEEYGTASSTPGWHDFILSSPAPVVSGTQYAILAAPVTGNFLDWSGDCTDVYAGGQALVKNGSGWSAPHVLNDTVCLVDFAFHTYVQPPSPQTSAPQTPPPTSTTSTDGSRSSMPWLLLALAGMWTAAAAVTIRRYGLNRR